MEWYERAQLIDFVWRSKHPDANDPKGYWFITEISIPISVSVYRKTSSNQWIRLSTTSKVWEEEAIKLGNLSIAQNGTVWVNGDLYKRLDEALEKYMVENNYNRYPYIYWNLETPIDD